MSKANPGTITQEKLITLSRAVEEQFAAELDNISAKKTGNKAGLKPRQIEDMKAGAADGIRAMIMALRAQGFLVVANGEPIARLWLPGGRRAIVLSVDELEWFCKHGAAVARAARRKAERRGQSWKRCV